MSEDNFNDFPLWAMLPKRETNVTSFLNTYPNYDGRGIKIAILDSGVDPGVPGMQKTSDGKVKILATMDASGAGDVDTSVIVEPVDGEITGLSGRKLKIPSAWKNPTNSYHIGLKNAFEIFPKQLKERLTKEHKEKVWDPCHKKAQAEASRELQEFNEEFPNPNQLSPARKLDKEEYEAAVDVLATLEKKYVNMGPTYDCVVFHDGDMWKAAIDTSEKGDLESCQLLGTYSESHEYGTFTQADRLNYTVNIYQDGNLLEIVLSCVSHGTHVASIAAAYFPDEPHKNGIAPGAQIVSISIADSRLGSMETGASVTRALIKVINMKCDIINMSYGEQANWSGGRVLELLHDVVHKHGVIMMSSAGNNGPALSTLTAPSVMHMSSVIAVGAYVSPEMMVAEYSLREKLPGTGYTWTSRGPALDGDLVVSIAAPGGAITSVPNWLLRGSQLMNGTSMSSPHAAGCVALLLSGLRSKEIAYSPYSIRRAIENTALKLHCYDPFSMGHGLLQVDKAFEYLTQYSNGMERDVRFIITHDHKQGIYLREAFKTKKPYNALVMVEPMFLNNGSADPDSKIAFQMNLKLICDAPWVTLPSHLSLMYASRNFVIRIDPCGLPHGEHFAWVKAYDSDCPEKGPVFLIPITVIKAIPPEELTNSEHSTLQCVLKPSEVKRQFYNVPFGATYAVLRIRSRDPINDCTLVVHALQFRPQIAGKNHEFHQMLRLSPDEDKEIMFNVLENRVLELVVAKWWTHMDKSTVDYTITFRGLKPDCPHLTIQSANGVHRVDISNHLKHETLSPSASLKSYVMVLRPSENKISPLRFRDVIPEGRQIYEIQLTYNFIIGKATEVQPSCFLSEFLYESEYESQLWMIFDLNKQLIACGDAYPNKYNIKLEKGDYVLKIQIRHEQVNLLEKLTDMPMLLQLKLQSVVNLDIYDKHAQALIAGKKCTNKTMAPGVTTPLFFAPLPWDKLPKTVVPGHHLLGSITFLKDDAAKKVNSYPLKYFITEAPKKNSSSKNSVEKEKDKEKDEEYNEALRDLKVSWIPKLETATSELLFQELMVEEKNHVLALISKLQFLEHREDRKHVEIIELANTLLTKLNCSKVLAYFGAKNDRKDSNHKLFEKQRVQVIETLSKKGNAMCDLVKENNSKTEEVVGDTSCDSSLNNSTTTDESKETNYSMKHIDEVYFELLKWTDITDPKVYNFVQKHALLRHHHARAIKLLLKLQEDKPTADNEKDLIRVYKELKWDHCVDFFERSLLCRFPIAYRLF